MPNQPKTPARAIRVDDDLWAELDEVAGAEETRSDVVREAITREVRRRRQAAERRAAR